MSQPTDPELIEGAAEEADADTTDLPVIPEARSIWPDPSHAAFAYTLNRPDAALLSPEQAASVAAWREILVAQGMLNQTTSYEQARAFGCLSVRDPSSAVAFTMCLPGGSDVWSETQLLRISSYNLDRCWVEAEGAEPPSVESLLHAAAYAADPRIQWVFQCRSEALATAAESLNIPVTDPASDPEAAPVPAWQRLQQLLQQNASRPLIACVPGHSASLFACATNARDAGGLLLVYLARALEERHLRNQPSA